MTRAVFLDRDGVLNKAFVRDGKPYSPDTIEEMIIVSGCAPRRSSGCASTASG